MPPPERTPSSGRRGGGGEIAFLKCATSGKKIGDADAASPILTTVGQYAAYCRSKEQNASQRDIVLLDGAAVPGFGLGGDVFAHQRYALGEAVIHTDDSGLVALEQVVAGGCFIRGELEVGDAVAEAEFQLVHFIGRLHVAAVGLAGVA